MICLIFAKRSLRIHLYRFENTTLLVTRAFKTVSAFVGMFYQRTVVFLTFMYMRSIGEYYFQLSINACY